MISIKDVTFSYNIKSVLENITIDFEENVVHGVVGLNGSGKTTFFNVLTGFLESDKGSITCNGMPIKKQDIAYIDAEFFFYPKITAREFLSVFPMSNTNFKEDELARLFNLPLEEFIESYSTGMKKKLLILSQLKQDKRIYIFDEPFNGLDIESNKALQIIIEILNKKEKTIFIASHIIEPLYTICHKIHHLKDKTILKTYLPTDYEDLDQEVFGQLTDQLKNSLNHSI